MDAKLYRKLVRILIVGIVAAIIHFVAMVPLVHLSINYLLIDGIIAGMLFALFFQIVEFTLKFSFHSSLSFIQQSINYCALALLFVVGILSLEAGCLSLLIPINDLYFFLPTLPTRIVWMLLSFICIVLYYNLQKDKEEVLNSSLIESVYDEPETPMIQEEVQELIEHIAVKKGSQIELIFLTEIMCIQAEGDYVNLHTESGSFLKEQTMKYLTDHLPKNKFVRVHRSFIVNIDYIRRIESYEKQQQIIILHNDLRVKVSIAGCKELKKVLNL